MESLDITVTVPAKDEKKEIHHFQYYMPNGQLTYGQQGMVVLSAQDKATIDEIISRNASNLENFKEKQERNKQ